MGSIAYVAIVGAAYLLLIYTSIAVAVKRLHDRDKSAWWLLVFYGAPLAVTAVAMALRLDEMISTIATMLIMIWAFVEFGCLRGTAGPNKYGADPLQEPQPWLRYH